MLIRQITHEDGNKLDMFCYNFTSLQVLPGLFFDHDNVDAKEGEHEFQEVVESQQSATKVFTYFSKDFMGGEESALTQDLAAGGQLEAPPAVPSPRAIDAAPALPADRVPSSEATEEDLILQLESDSDEPSGDDYHLLQFYLLQIPVEKF